MSAPDLDNSDRRKCQGWMIHASPVLTLLLYTASAFSQQETKDLAGASLEELGNIQVYSASKHLQSAHDAPSSVTVITADEIQKYG